MLDRFTQRIKAFFGKADTKTVGTRPANSQEVTKLDILQSGNAGKALLGIGGAVTAGLAIGGLIAGFSSIPGVFLLVSAAVGATILFATLALLHFSHGQDLAHPLMTTGRKEMMSEKRKKQIDDHIESLSPFNEAIGCRLDSEVLKKIHATADEVQYILTNHGQKFGIISLDGNLINPSTLNVSNCTNALEIYFKNFHELSDIAGLDRCKKLTKLNLSHCERIKKAPLVDSLVGLKDLSELNIVGSNLMRETEETNPDHLSGEDLKLLGSTRQSIALQVETLEHANELAAEFLLNRLAEPYDVEVHLDNTITGSATVWIARSYS